MEEGEDGSFFGLDEEGEERGWRTQDELPD